ncbi:MAG: tetrahydrofolate dehydrogenase/cyclohydrolase catalytic domain-containing protein [Gemmatimonadales bacterium]
MTARILDGVAFAATIRAEVRDEVTALAGRGVVPGLAVVLVGDDPASQVYVRSKGRACVEAGMHSETVSLPVTASEAEVLATIDRLNADPRVHGILCQLPLPPHLNAERVIRSIDPDKDVDGFHPVNVGKTVLGDPTGFRPATPFGVQELLIRARIPTEGTHAVIVGRSNIVGKPLANLLSLDTPGGNATTTLAHSRTRGLSALCRTADILVVGIGRAGFFGADAIKPGATVIDVGINRVDDATRQRGYRLAGDVDFDAVSPVAGAITPVPGGVGPMTIAMLLVNTVHAARARADGDA